MMMTDYEWGSCILLEKCARIGTVDLTQRLQEHRELGLVFDE